MDKRNENFKRNPFKVKLGKTQPSSETVSNFFFETIARQLDSIIHGNNRSLVRFSVSEFYFFLKDAPLQSLKQTEEQLPVFYSFLKTLKRSF